MRPPARPVAERQRQTISVKALVVVDDEVPVVALHGARYLADVHGRRAIDEALGVLPPAVGVEPVGHVAQRQRACQVPGDVRADERLPRFGDAIADVVVDEAHPAVDHFAGRGPQHVERLRRGTRGHEGRPEVLGELVVQIVGADLDAKSGRRPPQHAASEVERGGIHGGNVAVRAAAADVQPVPGRVAHRARHADRRVRGVEAAVREEYVPLRCGSGLGGLGHRVDGARH